MSQKYNLKARDITHTGHTNLFIISQSEPSKSPPKLLYQTLASLVKNKKYIYSGYSRNAYFVHIIVRSLN